MARPLRLEFPGALYHVTARGDRREPIVEDNADRALFLDYLGKEVSQQGWWLYAYCLMDNHYHLLIETPEPNLVRGMRRLNGVYTQAFNRRHGRVGHVFQGRYKAILVDKDNYLLELCRYVVLNPVRARMVKVPGRYPWSSYLATAGESSAPDGLATERVLALFGKRASTAQAIYRKFVAEGMQAGSPWEKLRGQIYLGDERFLAQLVPKLRGKRVAGVAHGQLVPLRPSAETVLADIAQRYGLDWQRGFPQRSHPAFKQAIYLLRRAANLSLAEVALRAGVSAPRVTQIQREIESGGLDKMAQHMLTTYQLKA